MVPVDFDGAAPATISKEVIEARMAIAAGRSPPPDYVRFAHESGGYRFPAGNRFVSNRDTGEVVGITTVYHYDDRVPIYLASDVWEQTRGDVPESLVPIASTEFAGEVCLDFRSPGEPRVVVYDYQADQGREVGVLADSFAEFVAAIGPHPGR